MDSFDGLLGNVFFEKVFLEYFLELERVHHQRIKKKSRSSTMLSSAKLRQRILAINASKNWMNLCFWYKRNDFFYFLKVTIKLYDITYRYMQARATQCQILNPSRAALKTYDRSYTVDKILHLFRQNVWLIVRYIDS